MEYASENNIGLTNLTFSIQEIVGVLANWVRMCSLSIIPSAYGNKVCFAYL